MGTLNQVPMGTGNGRGLWKLNHVHVGPPTEATLRVIVLIGRVRVRIGAGLRQLVKCTSRIDLVGERLEVGL